MTYGNKQKPKGTQSNRHTSRRPTPAPVGRRANPWTALLLLLTLLVSLAFIWRPLFFASVDPEVARARGVPMRTLSILFMVLLGLTTAMAVQLVGALLVLSLLITPTAAASKITVRPTMLVMWSILFAVVSAVGGILLSLGPGLPISPYVTTVSFLIYLVCLVIGSIRSRRGWGRRAAA